MRAMTPPKTGVSEVLEICNRKVSAHLAADFRVSLPALVQLELDYISAARAGALLSLDTGAPPRAVRANDDELRRLYLNRMVPIGSSGNAIYAQLRDADTGKCSLCDARDATQLDHHLSKEDHPTLAFTPVNLVPACDKCNGRKGKSQASSRVSEFFHPYFENLSQTPWLAAATESAESAKLVYRAYFSSGLPSDTRSRVLHQFRVLRLDETYAKFASSELAELQEQLKTFYGETPDAIKVQRYLVDSANAFAKARGINYWRAIAYKTWSLSKWFVNGGYATPL